jgi:hypothetical protein
LKENGNGKIKKLKEKEEFPIGIFEAQRECMKIASRTRTRGIGLLALMGTQTTDYQ